MTPVTKSGLRVEPCRGVRQEGVQGWGCEGAYANAMTFDTGSNFAVKARGVVMQQVLSRFSYFKLALTVGSALITPSVAMAQTAPTPTPAASDSSAANVIVVSGYRKSLEAGLNIKRQSISAVDAIVAEDIGKFPDKNLAESMQRIPGVAITRDGGEGREITVRGLGGNFTTVRVNGMEAQAASMNAGSGGTANTGRAFDFNIFPSELFQALIVHKTTEASLDEGSLGAVVDLNTGHPLGGKAGLTGALSAQGAYNDLSKQTGPKVAGLLNYRNADGTFGINLAAAYSHTKASELGNNTTRWAQAPFNSVTENGVTTACFNAALTKYTASPVCDQAALAFHPRIPRYGVITHDRERTGLTGAIEWAPSDHTHLEVDGLYSKYTEIRTEEWNEVLLRSDEKYISLVNPVFDANHNIVSATLNDSITGQASNYFIRDEHYYQKQNDTFYQINAKLSQKVGEKLTLNVLVGASRSDENVPIAETLMLDDKNATGYSYDYTNMHSPVLSFGPTDVTNPANFQLDEVRNAPTDTINKFKTAKLDAVYKANDAVTLKFGVVFRQFDFSTTSSKLDDVICPKVTNALDTTLGLIKCTATTYGYSASGLTDLVSLGSAGQPNGTTSQFVVANFANAQNFLGFNPNGTNTNPAYALALNTSAVESVTEKDTGAYMQVDGKGEIAGLKYALNAGVRYVKTQQSSTALTNINPTGVANYQSATVSRSYDDVLPAFNISFFPTSKMTVRLAASQVITRPSLSSLSPGGSVDSFNYKVSFGNPNLTPYRANNYDAAVEWYFARESLLSIGVFRKDVASFPTGVTTSGTYASTGLPLSLITPNTPAANNPNAAWTISTQTNGSGAKINGVEMGIQGPFRFLPGFLSHFGGILNATLINSTQPDTVSGPGTAVSSTGAVALVASTINPTFFGLSKKTFNGTLFYENGKFSGRVSIAYRGGYNDQNSATGNVLEGYGALTTVDASIRYKVTPNAEITLDGSNLTDAYQYHWTDLTAQRNYEYSHFGRNFAFGVRYKF